MTEPAPWTRIFQRVKTQIPACDAALIRQEIGNIVLDFTQDTNLWQETVPINVVPDVVDYPFTLVNGSANRLMVVYKDGDPNQYWADSWISMRVPGTIHLMRGQSEAVLWQAVIAKATSTYDGLGYPVLDNWVIDQHSDIIYYGTMWFLQRMPAKPWRDPNAANENQRLYSSQKAQARVQGMRKNVYDAQNWMFPQGFRTISRKGWA